MKTKSTLGLISHAEIPPKSRPTSRLSIIRSGLAKLTFMLLLLMAFTEVRATHVVGGEVTYSFLSSTATSNTYRIRLTLYRDCAGVNLGTSAQVSALNANNNAILQNFTLTLQGTAVDRSIVCAGQQSRCTNPQSNIPGVQEFRYEGNLTLSNSINFPVTVAHLVCCRPTGITNLVNPGSQETYLSTMIPPQTLNLNNNSPVFLNPPNGVFCQGQLASLSLNAFDADGDALVYSLVAARRGSVVQSPQPVQYAGTFTALAPMSSSTPVTINTATGVINFTPSVLNQRSVVAVRVEEYRNAIKIGEVFRDLEVTTINCGSNTAPVIAPINNMVVQVGQTVCIPVNVTDANGNNIAVTATGGIIPPATFTINSSGPGFTNGVFCFTPTLANAANTYAISISAVDNFCPIPAGVVTTFNLTVPCPQAIPLQTSSTPASCGLADGSATASMAGGVAPFAYSWTGPNGFTASSQAITGVAAGSYSITVVDGNNCTGSSVVTVAGSATPIVINGTVNDALCGQNNGSLDLSANGGVAPYSFALNGGATQGNGQFANLAPATYTITVLDANSCPATATYVINAGADVTPPTAICQNVTLYLDANGNANIYAADVDNGSYDNCNSITLGLSAASFDCSHLGANTVTLTVTDASNNMSSCTAVVTVLDTIAPDLHCQDTTLYLNANGQATLLTAEVLDHEHEACPITSIWLSQSNFSCANVGTNTVTVYATDNSNNTGTCTSTVTVIDNSAPTADVANLPTVNAECNVTVPAPTATDNCAGSVTASTNDATSYSAQGTYIITWNYNDGNGNTSSQSQTVVINDATPPTANCKSFTLELSNGTGTVNPADVNDNSSDNCGIATMSVSPNTFTCADAGVQTVTLTVVDVNGNSSSCTANVTVQYQPTCSIVSVPANNVYTGGNPNNIYLGYGPQSATLNSSANGGNGFTYSWSPATYLSCTNCASPVFTPTAAGTITYTLTVTNSNGCTTTCEVTMCVIDARATGKGNNGKVIICHVPPGNPNNPQTLSISPNAVNTHLTQHAGDQLGACGNSCGVAKGVAEVEGQLLENEGFETIVYPNPTSNEFTIVINSDSKEAITASMYDIMGKKIMDMNDIRVNEPYTVRQSLANGIYLIHIGQNGHQQTVRLIRQD